MKETDLVKFSFEITAGDVQNLFDLLNEKIGEAKGEAAWAKANHFVEAISKGKFVSKESIYNQEAKYWTELKEKIKGGMKYDERH